ncbi:hypothetical protein [Marinobacter alexandrii]|uniref:hypothetical protein n=1 Tax=Marinobacter alexandrii TaxID=2570351 RepID=UPI003266E11F
MAFVILGIALVYAVAQTETRWVVYFCALAFCCAVTEFLFFSISKGGHLASPNEAAKASRVTGSFFWRRAISLSFASFFFISMVGSQLGDASISAIFYGIACLASWAPAGKKRWYSLPAKYALVAAATALALYYQPNTVNFN